MVKKTVEIETKVTGEGQAKSKLGSLGDFIKKRLVVTLGDLTNIGRSVIGFFVEASKSAQEQEKVTAKLNQALKNQGIFTQQTTDALQKQASAFKKVSNFGDEAIITLQTQLINFGILPKDIDRVTQATLDLAEAQGMDLESAGSMLSKSLGSSTNAMARWGIEINGAVGSTERLDSAVNNIAKRFGGQAKASTETLTGSLNQLEMSWGDLQETIMTTNNNAIQPYVKALNSVVESVDDVLKLDAQFRTAKKAEAVLLKGNWEEIQNLTSAEMNLGIERMIISQERKEIFEKEKGLVDAETKMRNKATWEAIKSYEQISKAKEKSEKNKPAKKKTKEELEQEAKEREEARKKELEASTKAVERKYNKEKESRELTIEDEIKMNEDMLAIKSLNEDERSKLLIEKRELLGEKQKQIEEKILKEKEDMRQMFADLEVIGTATKSKELVEIAKALAVSQATIDAYVSFNKTLASLPYPFNVLPAAQSLATGLANVATIASTPVTFAQGGQFEAQPQAMQTSSGQTAISNEKGLEIHRVEAIGRTQSSGGTIVPIIINLGGVELKRLAVDLKPYLNRGVS